MKNLKVGLILFLVVLVSGSTMAMGALKVYVVPGKNEKALVDVLLAPDSRLEVALKDSNGDVIYNEIEEARSFNYKKLYDFSILNNGKYTFEAKLGDETALNDIVVNNGTIKINGGEEQVVPQFKLIGKDLEVTYPNSADESVRLMLYDNDTHSWVYQENLIPEYNIDQSLDLSKLDRGSYKAVLVSGEISYDYSFNLN